MLDPMLRAIVVGGIVATLAFLALLIRDRGLVSRRFVVSELVGVVGGFGAVLFMQPITHSGLADVAGPLDRLLMVSIWLIGAIGTTVIVYDLRGLRAGRRAPFATTLELRPAAGVRDVRFRPSRRRHRGP